jgi:hypothetical protein
MKTLFSSSTLLVLCAGTMLFLSSCDKRIRKEGSGVLQNSDRSLDNFSAIEANGAYDIIYHVDEESHVEILTDNNITGDVQTFVVDGRLIIEMNDDYFNYHFTKMELNVYGPTCNDVDLNGSVEFNMADTVYTDEMDVYHNGSGYAGIKFSGESLKMEVNGSADMNAVGNATYAAYIIHGSGKIDALDLEAYDVNAEISGSGDIYTNCTHYLHATISGSGHIKYIGNPTVETEISGSGNVGPY